MLVWDAQRSLRMNKLNIFCMEKHHIVLWIRYVWDRCGQTYIVSFIRRHTCRSGNNNGEIFFFLSLRPANLFFAAIAIADPSKLARSLVPSAKPVSCFFIISLIFCLKCATTVFHFNMLNVL